MARSRHIQPDSSLARPHDAGVTVRVLQVLSHRRYGGLGYHWPRFWVLEFKAWQRAHELLASHHEEVLALPVDQSAMRVLEPDDGSLLLLRVYEAGSQLLNASIRTIQHLCVEIEKYEGLTLQGTATLDRLNEAMMSAGFTLNKTADWYQGLVQLVRVRDALEHPTQSRVYNHDEWSEVPLAWLLSDRSLVASENALDGVDALAEQWEARVMAIRAASGPTELEASGRGLRSTLQFKKPPGGEGNT